MMKRLMAKYLLMVVVGLMLMAGVLPAAQGTDAKRTPTPSDRKVTVTPTPSPSEATVEATNEARQSLFTNPYADIPFSRTEDGAPVLGNPDAPITIIEFADYACPYCQRYEPTVQEFIQGYVATGRAKFEFRILPTAGGHMTEIIGSVVSCFEDQRAGVFWPLHNEVYAYAEQGQYDEKMIQSVAEHFDLSYADAVTCIGQNGRPLQSEIDRQLAHSLGIRGTPGIRVRYKGHNNEEAQYLIVDGKAWTAGGAPLRLLGQAVEDAEAGNIPDAEVTPDVPIVPGNPV